MPADAVVIAPIADPAGEAGLATLFVAMYDDFAAVSGRSYLNDRAFALWLGHYAKVAGRSRLLVGAWEGARLIGFAEGTLRAAPAYFDAGVSGFVAHLYVSPAYRGQSVARGLYGALGVWFAEKQVAAVELQVVTGNEPAHRFWQGLGFAPDNMQYRKLR